MKILERNKQQFYYSLYEGKSDVKDDYGNKLPKYSEAVSCRASVSSEKGNAENEAFGTNIDYNRVIITDDMACPIDEQSVLFVDIKPKYDEYGKPLGDYIVTRVARSLNNISYAIKRVNLS